MISLPITAKPYTNVEKLGNQGIAEFIDCQKDDGMNNVARVGLGGPVANALCDIGTASVNSVYEWETQGIAVAVGEGRIFSITQSGIVTEITGATLTGGNPVSFADYGNTLYMANGGAIVAWDSADSTCATLSDVDAPTQVTHLAVLNTRLLARQGDILHVSEAGDPTDWRAIQYEPEMKPDRMVALHSDWEEVALFGTKTVEFWSDTGSATDPLQRLSGTTAEHGTISPYSVALFDQSYWFLDYMRRVVRLAIRSPQVMSNPFESEFAALANVVDCRILHFPLETTVVFTFPSEDKSYAYDYKRDVWARWTNLRNGVRERFLGNCACYMRSWNKQLVGSRKNGKIHIASEAYTSDGGDEIIPLVRTGALNFGTQGWKHPMGPNALLLKVKRGQVLNPSVEPFIQMRYRKESGEWSQQKTVNLGRGGEMNPIGKIRPIGRFRNIEFEFSWDASAMTALVSGEINL